MKRREFLASSITAGAALAIPAAGMVASVLDGATGRAGSGATMAAGSQDLSRASFERLLHTPFRITAEGRTPVVATLTAVTDSRHSGTNPHLEQFSTTFALPADADVSGLCAIEHTTAGRFELFLDRQVRSGRAHTCQAQFSHLIA